MSKQLTSRLEKALSRPLVIEASNAPLSQLGRDLGFTAQAEGKTTDDLALTRFPLGVPLEWVKKLEEVYEGISADMMPFAIKLSEKDIYASIFNLTDEVEFVEPWTVAEVINACWPIIATAVRRYTKGGWEQGDMAADFAQTAVLGLMKAINSEKDAGGPYLKWVKVFIRGAISSGVGVDSQTNAASGFYGDLIKSTKPAQVDVLIDKIDEEDRTNPRKPKDGNRYGEYAPILYAAAVRLKELYEKIAAAGSKEEMAEAKEEAVAYKESIQYEQESLKGSGRILGALTGAYDTITTTHSDTRESRFLKKLVNIRDAGGLEKLGAPPKQVKELYDEYVQALQADNEELLQQAIAKIDKWMHLRGDRDAFRKSFRRQGVEVQGASGKEIENPNMPSAEDTFDEDIENKEIVKQLIIAGLEGVEFKTPEGKLIDRVQLDTRDFRILIRMFGIADYPYKGDEDRDPEIDREKLHEYDRQLEATVGSNNPDDGVEVKPVNTAEAHMLIDLVARQVSENYDEYKLNVKHLVRLYKMHGITYAMASNDDMVIDLAERLASSKWVRIGCPQLNSNEIQKEIFPDVSDNARTQKMKKLIGVPKDRKRKYVSADDILPDSKMARLIRILKAQDDPKWREIERMYKNESIIPASAAKALIESAIMRLWQISDHCVQKAMMTESLDRIDFHLLNNTHRAICRRVIKTCLGKS